MASQFHMPEAIEPYSAELVGATRGIVLGKKSGLDSIRLKAEELGIELAEAQRAPVLQAVKRAAIENGRLITDEEFLAIVGQLGAVWLKPEERRPFEGGRDPVLSSTVFRCGRTADPSTPARNISAPALRMTIPTGKRASNVRRAIMFCRVGNVCRASDACRASGCHACRASDACRASNVCPRAVLAVLQHVFE